MATFVLVHGGWSGAHGWRKVRRLLAAHGHEVFTPSLTGNPARCFTEPIPVVRPVEDYDLGLTYIKATADSRDAPGGNAFWDTAERVRTSSRWSYREIATNHMVASNRPQELATLLIEVSAATRRSR